MARPAHAAVTELVLEIFRLNGELIAMGDALVGELGLTSARWQVIGAIALAATPLSIAQIARNMGLARQSVQRVANELAAEGFVHFAPNPHHRRAKLVLLTPRGESAYAAATARWTPKASGLAAGVKIRDIDAALAVLRHIRTRMERLDPSGAKKDIRNDA
ncbi:MAG: MarR family transcriptional regulator [Pseudorhodoplanes sp.]|nr:MarR family transcriptional regulator [Pseudorhodoplanes sp.]